ncbi:MAG: tetratricopeptide repeat protein [Desulfobacteraceae bacterium]|nr:tetratricopeptide repeat protein [Desulfobacteraceae bacterium]
MNIANMKNDKILSFLIVTGMIALLSCVSFTSAIAGQGDDLFALGNEAYAEGKYDEAISYYKEVTEQEGYSASLLYNMANAYYQKKDVGQAILHYERALYLDPGNADIQANLGLARKDFGLISEPAPNWQRFFDLLNLNWWAILASGAFGVFSLLYLLRGIRPGILTGAPFKVLTTVCLLCFMAGGTGVAMQYKNMSRGVVIRDNARLLVSPFDSASSSASIKDGKIVRIAKTYRGYLLVEGVNGKSGWIKRNAVEPVVPSGERS